MEGDYLWGGITNPNLYSRTEAMRVAKRFRKYPAKVVGIRITHEIVSEIIV